MVRLTANLTPQAWAVFEAVFATLGAPGMCNPDDEHPCVSGTPTQQQIDDDHRTLQVSPRPPPSFPCERAWLEEEDGPRPSDPPGS
jgi:hypothetical protein